jgi:hypothetical protein
MFIQVQPYIFLDFSITATFSHLFAKVAARVLPHFQNQIIIESKFFIFFIIFKNKITINYIVFFIKNKNYLQKKLKD